MKISTSARFSSFAVAILLASVSWAKATVFSSEELRNQSYQAVAPESIHKATNIAIVKELASQHYAEQALDDTFSSTVFDRYLDNLDPSHSFFLATDINSFERYRNQLDDAMRSGDLGPGFHIFNVYQQRYIDRLKALTLAMEKGVDQFDFKLVESLETDRAEIPWPQNAAEADEIWRRRLKASVLNLKLAKKDPEKIIDLLGKRFRNQLHRALQVKSEDVFEIYMNSLTLSYDPHTQYFSPRTSENFNINMSLQLEGIGAVLQTVDEYTKVQRLITGGPADLAGDLGPADRIIGVGQDTNGEIIDVIGWRLDEVVQLIRGPKNSLVRLQLIPAGSDDESLTKVIEITRDQVKLEEQSAKSEVIEIEQAGSPFKVGVIKLPTFYIDFKGWQARDPNYKSSTRDVQKLLEELKTQDIDGVVVDLRGNGGGSLLEANRLTGLFIKSGPTVQIRSSNNKFHRQGDPDPRVTYSGPLVVLVDRLSASASEIFAGAIQDYGRGLIVGGQTFGKGTVQTLRRLDHGQLKLTQSKFYRISGASTQHQGVSPDISYPSLLDKDVYGESTLESALPWDRIKPLKYAQYDSLKPSLSELQQRHDNRISNDPDFIYIKEQRNYLDENRDKTQVSLNEAQRLVEREKAQQFRLDSINKRRNSKGKTTYASIAAMEAELSKDDDTAEDVTAADVEADPANTETSAVESPEAVTITDDTKALEDELATKEEENQDAYLVESGQVLLNLVNITSRLANIAKPSKQGQVQ